MTTAQLLGILTTIPIALFLTVLIIGGLVIFYQALRSLIK